MGMKARLLIKAEYCYSNSDVNRGNVRFLLNIGHWGDEYKRMRATDWVYGEVFRYTKKVGITGKGYTHF
jgi:hypothetical protein